jgi:hypothetical protein
MKRILLLSLSALLVSANLAQAQTSMTLPQAQATVNGWYQQFLNRQPDPSAAGWVLALVNGKSAGDVLSSILASKEFFRDAGRTNVGFVSLLYQDQLGRAPTPAELTFWTNMLRNKSRKRVAFLFLASQGNIAAVPQNQTQRGRHHHDRDDKDDKHDKHRHHHHD